MMVDIVMYLVVLMLLALVCGVDHCGGHPGSHDSGYEGGHKVGYVGFYLGFKNSMRFKFKGPQILSSILSFT